MMLPMKRKKSTMAGLELVKKMRRMRAVHKQMLVMLETKRKVQAKSSKSGGDGESGPPRPYC